MTAEDCYALTELSVQARGTKNCLKSTAVRLLEIGSQQRPRNVVNISQHCVTTVRFA